MQYKAPELSMCFICFSSSIVRLRSLRRALGKCLIQKNELFHNNNTSRSWLRNNRHSSASTLIYVWFKHVARFGRLKWRKDHLSISTSVFKQSTVLERKLPSWAFSLLELCPHLAQPSQHATQSHSALMSLNLTIIQPYCQFVSLSLSLIVTQSYCHSASVTVNQSYCFTQPLSLPFSLTVTQSLSHYHSALLSLSPSLTIIQPYCHSASLTIIQPYCHSVPLSLSLSLTVLLSLSHYHSALLSLCLTVTHSHCHHLTGTHSHSHSH